MSRGKLIVIEGLDGSGKSTLSRGIAAKISALYPLVRYAEPGGTPLGERLRGLIKDPSMKMLPTSEALLFAAARAELSARIREDLESGSWVLLDRWVPSSVAYQGYGRELGGEEVEEMNRWATGDLQPDLVLYLRISAAASSQRIKQRGIEKDRIELAGNAFFQRAQQGYEEWVGRTEYARSLDAKLDPNQLVEAAWGQIKEII